MSENKILIFIPMYNCEAQIPRVVDQLAAYRDCFEEAIIVDNGSPDGSIESAKKRIEEQSFQGKVGILKNKENYSLGGSHKVAFEYAAENGFTHVLVLHGDDQAKLSDIVPYLKDKTYLKYDAFLGARFHPQSKLVGYSRFRTFGNKTFNFLCKLVLGQKIHDMNAGINIYSVNLLKRSRYKLLPDDLTFNTHHLFEHVFNKEKIGYFPITWVEEDQVSNARVFKQAARILKLMIRYVAQPDPFSRKDANFDEYPSERIL